MRNSPNDPLASHDAAGPGRSGPGRSVRAGAARRGERADPERRCILSGERTSPDRLIRLAIAPDGMVLPDVMGRAPGRGAWIGVPRAELESAIGKGRLRGALARAFKGAPLTVPGDLPDRIEVALSRATLDRLGLEARASNLIHGAERVEAAARGGAVALLLHAADAAEDGRRKLDQAWRVGAGEEGSGRRGLVLPVDRDALSMALGRHNAVHVALTDAAAADRVLWQLRRWLDFCGTHDATMAAHVAASPMSDAKC